MKIAKWAGLAVLVVLIVGGLVLYFSLNSIIRSTVERQTESQLHVETRLNSANLSLFGGSLNLSGFELGSPQGFAAPQMFQMRSADMKVRYGQLRDDPVRIESITIQRPVLVVEHVDGKFNIKALMDQMVRPDTPQPADERPLHLVIDRLTITEPSVVMRPGVPGLAEEIRLPLSNITMENIGTGPGAENGAAVQEVVMAVITRMADVAADSDKLPEQLKMLLQLDTSQMAAAIGDVVGREMQKVQQQVQEQLQQQLGAPATQMIDDALRQRLGEQEPGQAVERGLRDLLGGRERRQERTTPTTQP